MAISVKSMCLLAFLLVLLSDSLSEVAKALIVGSFINGPEAVLEAQLAQITSTKLKRNPHFKCFAI